MAGGFFLLQETEIDFAGQFQVKSHEPIGYDPETGAFASQVYSNLSCLRTVYVRPGDRGRLVRGPRW